MTPRATTTLRVRAVDGVTLHVQQSGAGPAVVFAHELMGNSATFAPVIAALDGRFRCIAYNARGYPPSDVPVSAVAYCADAARSDLLAVLDALGLERVHLVGVSMGAACCLQVALASPHRVASLVLASIGTGSDAEPAAQAAQIEGMAAQFEQNDLRMVLQELAGRPNRRTMIQAQPVSWSLFQREFLNLSATAVAATLRGVQKQREPIYALEPALRSLQVSCLIMLGSEDAPCRKPCEFLARVLPQARLEVVQGSGHTPNLEQPEAFAALCEQSITAAEGAR